MFPLRFNSAPAKGRLAVLAAGMAVTAALTLLQIMAPATLGFLEREVYDHYVTRPRKVSPSGLPVVVDLDEKSLQDYGQWPWPRYRLALLLGLLRKAGARSVALDVLFSEPDRTSPDMVKRQLKEDLGIDVEYQGLPSQFNDFDALMGRMLRTGPFVLSFFMDLNPSEVPERDKLPCPVRPLAVTLVSDADDSPALSGVAQGYGIKCPMPVLAEAAPDAGFFNALPDRDNIIRRGPALIAYDGRLYPGLGLAAALKAFGVREALGKVSQGQLVSLVIDFPGRGKRSIPLDRDGNMLINYRGKGGYYPKVSASDVLAGKMSPDFVKDKIVFVGTSAVGLLDLQATPMDPVTPGVEIQATVADMILSGDFIQRPSYAEVAETACTLLAGAISASLLAWATSGQLLLPFALLAAALWFAAEATFTRLGIYLSPVYPMTVLTVNFGLLSFLKFWREERLKRFIHGAFSRFISPKVVEEIMRFPDKLTLTGEEREVTVLVTDIRNFSTFSEKLTPNQTAELLQTFFTPITRNISQRSGTIDKFFGDAVMAFWNAPLDLPQHGRLSVECAVALSEAAQGLKKEMMDRFNVALDIGVGIHKGIARVGNFGSEDMFNYTVIGDTVNLCWRLEGLTKYYGVRIIASDSLLDSIPEGVKAIEIDRVRVKGKSRPTALLSLYTAGEYERRQAEFELALQGLAAYRAMDFAASRELFARLDGQYDRKLYSLYLSRCEKMIESPPGPDWDGIFTHTKK